MKKNIELDTGKKIFPIAVMVAGIGLMLALLIGQLNIIAVVSVAFMCIVSALIVLGLIFKNKVYAPFVFAYAFAGIGIAVLGPVVLRLVYEGFMMFIILVKNVVEINNKTKKD